MKFVWIGFTLANAFWFVMFSPWTAQKVNFWAVMSLAGVFLTLFSFFIHKKEIFQNLRISIRNVFWGIISAIILYFVFYFGGIILKLTFPFAESQIGNVYKIKEGTSVATIAFLLLFIIGPAEEIFWRGFVQSKLSQKINNNFLAVFYTTLLYTVVHIWAFNPVLLVAAFVCGLFWGYLFQRYKSLALVIVSHSLWDFLAFILFPF